MHGALQFFQSEQNAQQALKSVILSPRVFIFWEQECQALNRTLLTCAHAVFFLTGGVL